MPMSVHVIMAGLLDTYLPLVRLPLS